MGSLPGGPESVEVYATSAARAAALPSPVVGQAVVTLDDGALSIYYGKYLGWRPPWNQPWGEVARAHITANAAILNIGAPSSTGNRIPGLIIAPWRPVYNRQYDIIMDVAVTGGANGDFIDVGIQVIDPTDKIYRVTQEEVVISDAGFAPDPIRSQLHLYAPDGFFTADVAWGQPYTVCVAANMNGGSNTGAFVVSNTNHISSIVIEDRGPRGGPLIS